MGAQPPLQAWAHKATAHLQVLPSPFFIPHFSDIWESSQILNHIDFDILLLACLCFMVIRMGEKLRFLEVAVKTSVYSKGM